CRSALTTNDRDWHSPAVGLKHAIDARRSRRGTGRQTGRNVMQLSHDKLKWAYQTMQLIRAFEDPAHEEFATGAIPGVVHRYAGEEAAAVGVCIELKDSDHIASTHRGHGHCLAKGCDPEAMMKEIFGRGDGLCGGKGGSMHIADLSRGMMGANGIV